MSDSDPSANLFEDANASHPLDLLINAISGSGQYQIPAEARDSHGEFDLEQLLSGTHAQQDNDKAIESNSKKRPRSPASTGAGARGSKIAKLVKEHVVHRSNSRTDKRTTAATDTTLSTPSAFSTIEVWHPTAGQKSYGKERRMLNPPPILRVTGPILPLLTQATLRTVLSEAASADYGVLSSQSQRIPLSAPEPASSPTPTLAGAKPRRSAKEEKARKLREKASKYGFGQTLPYERNKHTSKEREALSDGLIFPGLWVAEAIGKEKEFRLELSLGMPGVEDNGEAQIASGMIKHDPGIEVNIDPALDGSSDIRQNDQATGGDLFGDHQTLEQASTDIINQMTEEDRRLFETAQQTSIDPGNATQGTHDEAETAIAPETAPPPPPGSSSPHSWATFTSSTLSVVSKPSQKTAKARSMDSCLGMDDSFALWVRINGQTVRTKYMKLDEGDSPRLTSRTTRWSPFKFEIVERAAPIYSVPDRSGNRNPRDRSKGLQSDRILTYGSIGCLVDLQSGVKTEAMRLVKIDKNENVVGTDLGHPVSDLQRVGFLRLVNGQDDYTGGGRWYLSAPAARLGGAELHALGGEGEQKELGSAETPAVDGDEALGEGSTKKSKPRKKKTKRFALAEVVVAEDAGGVEFTLNWSKADRHEGERSRGFGKDIVKKAEVCEKVEDWMCWVIGGVSNFTCSVFDGHESGSLLQKPIEPVLRNLAPPIFDAESNSLILTLNEFFDTSAHHHDPSSSEVYLGPIGPVHTSLYRSVAPEKAGADNGHSSHFVAEPFGPEPFDGAGIQHPVRSDYPSHKPHVIVVVGMPAAETIIKSMQECFAEAQYQAQATSTLHSVPAGAGAGAGAEAEAEAQGWLNTNDGSTSDHVYIHDAPSGGNLPQTTGNNGGIEVSTQAPVDHTQDLAMDSALTLDLERQSQAQAQTQHNVDDITAALAAHASDPGFSLSQIDEHSFLAANLDPALNDPSTTMQEYQDQVYETANPPGLELRKSDQGGKKIEMVPLPIVLVRVSDGVGFSVGRNVVAERVDGRGPGEKPRWGLRIVEG